MLIEKIYVAPSGHRPITEKRNKLIAERTETKEDFLGQFLSAVNQPGLNDEKRYFATAFRDGTVRVVFPNNVDPQMFDDQMLLDRD